ncbi:hypothetical protein IWX78_000030 [Mycetocola sp. CAN_C7]|uniref:hypothetical protein n=1 Tax=Mycetocola sp. CAN_C7 TaxID=2787724 RepID=UPI0018CB81BC
MKTDRTRAFAFVPPLLVVVAIPLIRPNLFGEIYSLAGTIIILGAGFLAFAADRGRINIPRSTWTVAIFVALATVWILIRLAYTGGDRVQVVAQDLLTSAAVVLAVGIVASDQWRLRFMVRGFIYLVVALSASYLVTILVWQFAGIGSFELARVPISARGIAGISFPFTPTFGTQTIFGVTMPRLTGLGREPGWMGLYCGVAYFLWPLVGRAPLFGRLLLVVGLLGTISTASFGAFVVVLVVSVFIRVKWKNIATQYLGLLIGIIAVLGAVWVAFNAPVLGFAQKGEFNAESLSDRSIATNAGINAIFESPLGGSVEGGAQAGINMISTIASNGIPYFVLIAFAIWWPMVGRVQSSEALPGVALIFITLLLSQPPGSSAFVFVLVGLIYACAQPATASIDAPASLPPTTGRASVLR